MERAANFAKTGNVEVVLEGRRYLLAQLVTEAGKSHFRVLKLINQLPIKHARKAEARLKACERIAAEYLGYEPERHYI